MDNVGYSLKTKETHNNVRSRYSREQKWLISQILCKNVLPAFNILKNSSKQKHFNDLMNDTAK